MPPHNSSSALADNRPPHNSNSALANNLHLHAPFPQNTESQLRTNAYASLASVNQSKSIESQEGDTRFFSNFKFKFGSLASDNAENLHQQRSSMPKRKASEAESHSPTEHALVAQVTETHSSNSSLSVQSSGPMDLDSASCNISSLRDVELAEDDRMELSALLSGPAGHEVLIDKLQINMTRKKISCLKPRTWLNDEVINFYGEMMMQEGGSIYSFSTFFMIRLYERGTYTFKNVARWTKNLDIFRQKKVFIPINHKNTYWVLVVIDLTIKTTFFL